MQKTETSSVYFQDRKRLSPLLLPPSAGGKWSDLDLLVVAEYNLSFLERTRKLSEINDTRAPIEALGYTLNEAHTMLVRGNPFILEVLENGILLMGHQRYTVLWQTFEKMEEEGLRRTKNMWVPPP